MSMRIDYSTVENLTPMEAIRAYCLDCMCGSSNEVKLCPSKWCPLYRYRTGKTGHTLVLSEEERARRSERMKELRREQLNSAKKNN